MTGLIENHFSFTYESSASESYLVIEADISEHVLNYQVEMMVNNEINGILPVDIRQKDNKINFYYKITSKLSLSQFLRRKKLKKNDFITLLSGVAKVLLDCKNYLLIDKNFILEEDHIYINPSTLEISLAYLPIKMEANTCEKFRDFVTHIIINTAQIEESKGDVFFQRILNYLKADTFNIMDFNLMLNDLINNSFVDPKNEYYIEEEKNPACRVPPFNNIPPIRETQVHKELADKKCEPLKIPTLVIFAILTQVVIVIILFLSSDFLKSLSDNVSTTYAGVVLIILSIDILIFKSLFKNKAIVIKRNKQDLNEENKVEISEKEVQIFNKNIKHTSGSLNDMNFELQEEFAMDNKENLSVNENILPDNSNETMLLEYTQQKYPFLQKKKDGILEQINITKTDFFVGRMQEQVDYVFENNAIGKVHAQIISRNGNYLIKDLNSKNGTFINDVRIDSNKEYEIKNSDKISFANSDYTFFTA